jgi:ParB family chromosome partitioning protein
MAATPKKGLGRGVTKGVSKGLGRGFDTLLPQDFDRSILMETGEKIQKLTLDDIVPHKGQPRTHFDNEALVQLATSIKRYGVLQPIIVKPSSDNQGKNDTKYIIVAGERRWRASKLAGQKTIPAIIRTLKDLEHLELALVENVQRVDLSPLEQAVSIEHLHQQFSLNYEAIAERLGKAVSTVNNMVRLLQLPQVARDALDTKSISEGHGRALLALKNQPDQQQDLLDLILKNGWSVRQAERYVIGLKSLKQGDTEKQAIRERVDTETPATKALSKRLSTPVHIRRTAKGGRLELSFTSDEQLQKLIDLLETLNS